MIIYIDENKYEEKEIDDLFNNCKIEYIKYDNEYIATCKEEIEQAIDCSDIFQSKTFYDIAGDKADSIIWTLAKELYNSKEANKIFLELNEAASLIVNKKLYNIVDEIKTSEERDFCEYAKIYGLKKEDYGKTIIYNGEEFSIIGFQITKRKYPVVGKKTSTGELHSLALNQVKKCLKEQQING